MPLDPSQISEGFLAHLIGGIIGGVVGWFLHAAYGLLLRKRQHAQFDREIVEFATQLQRLVSLQEIPTVMARVVPLASKATFGTEVPPLKERHSFPKGVKLNCKICKRSIEPTFEGRCATCKLGCTSYHESAKDL